jgi:hypothetical protein
VPAAHRWQAGAFDVSANVPAEQSAQTVFAAVPHAVTWCEPGPQVRQP